MNNQSVVALVLGVAVIAGGGGYLAGSTTQKNLAGQVATESEVTPIAEDSAVPASSPGPALPTPTSSPPAPTSPPPAESGPTPLPDKWTVNADTSAMDDSPSVTAILVSENEDRVNAYRSASAALIVRCLERKTDVYVAFDAFLGSGEVSVRTRLDDDKARDASWGVSTDNKAAFAPSAIAFAKQLAKTETFRIRLTPFNESPIEYSFDVRGLDKHLPRIAEACDWKP